MQQQITSKARYAVGDCGELMEIFEGKITLVKGKITHVVEFLECQALTVVGTTNTNTLIRTCTYSDDKSLKMVTVSKD